MPPSLPVSLSLSLSCTLLHPLLKAHIITYPKPQGLNKRPPSLCGLSAKKKKTPSHWAIPMMASRGTKVTPPSCASTLSPYLFLSCLVHRGDGCGALACQRSTSSQPTRNVIGISISLSLSLLHPRCGPHSTLSAAPPFHPYLPPASVASTRLPLAYLARLPRAFLASSRASCGLRELGHGTQVGCFP